MNPFTALGLPADPDLTDEQVRAAWRTIAAATHPDRPDGGDPARYAAAADRLRPAPHRMGTSPRHTPTSTAGQPYVPAPAAALPVPPGAGIVRALRLVPARIRHGRPWRLLLRALVAAAAVAAGPAPGPGTAVRARRRDRPDHLVRADRAGGPGPAAGPVTR